MKETKLKSASQLKHQQIGVTLLELMVAMAVSSVIMLGISNIYLSTKKSYVIHDEFARIQENARYSMDTLSRDIRNAGFFGCASGQGVGTTTNGLKLSNEVSWNFQTGIMGFEAVGTDIGQTLTITPNVVSGNQADWTTVAGMTSGGTPLNAVVEAQVLARAIAGSDILVIRTTAGLGVRVAQNNDSGQVFLTDTTGGFVANACPQNSGPGGLNVNGISGICEGDILLVSDCAKSRIFQAANIQTVGGGPGACGGTLPCFNVTHPATGDPGNADVVWTAEDTYGPDSEIIQIVTKTYFVGLPIDAAGVPIVGGEPSLFVQNNGGRPQQLAEGIENMQILYGVDTTGDGVANRYFSANNVPDTDSDPDTIFESVVSVKLSFLARTPQNLPGLNRTAADADGLLYAMVSPAPASAIIIDPVAPGDTTDRRMRKVFNLNIQIRNKSLNISN